MPFSYFDFINSTREPGEPERVLPVFEPPRLTPLVKPISESTVAIFSSAGVHTADQRGFEVTNDLSYRMLPRHVPLADLTFDHETPVRVWAARDLNVAYPLERMVELESDGTIGRLADRSVSMLGAIHRYTELIQETVPRIVDELRADDVDLVFLFPF